MSDHNNQNPIKNDIVVVSDIHLGSDICQCSQFVKFLTNLNTKTLIINGDLFDSWDFRKLRKDHWKILKKLRQLSDTTHIVWIAGNHDGSAELIGHLIGVDFVSEYIVVNNDKKILLLHGDIFDNFISKYPRLTKIADTIYRLIQRLDKYHSTQYYYSNWAKRSSKTYTRCSEQIAHRAIEYARSLKCDAVICGHTHALLTILDRDVQYVNSGCWTEIPCCYLTINDGKIKTQLVY
jgi:UDP-2,3-diacylglucosamine pyrophosphatase LpxH